MKKEEAKQLALQRSQLIIEYIEQILSDNITVNGKMDFSVAKIDDQSMAVLDIYVPKRNFKKHLNLGITSNHLLILYEQLLNDLLNTFLEHETIGISKYYSIKFMMGKNFSGIDATNFIGSEIKINLNGSGTDFYKIVSEYNQRINEYIEFRQNNEFKEQKHKSK